MKLSLFSAGLALLAASASAATSDCTTAQRQKVNSLLSTSSGSGKSCYEATGKEDIQDLSTTTLCTLDECVEWLTDVADGAPSCYYEATNYADLYARKLEDCPTSGGSSSSDAETGSSASSSSSSSASASDSSSGSGNSTTTKKPTTTAPSASASGSEEEEVGVVASSSGSEDLEVDTIDTPEPTEDTSVETLAPESSGSESASPEAASGSNGAASVIAGSLVLAVTLAASGAAL